MGGSRVALALYRAMLRSSRELTTCGRTFSPRSPNGTPRSGTFHLYTPDQHWWREELGKLVPGIIPGTEPGEPFFTGATLARCVRENFRANQRLIQGGKDCEQAIDTGMVALKIMRRQIGLEETSAAIEAEKGIRVEVTSWFDGEEDEGYRFAYRVSIQNTSATKVKLREAVWDMMDGNSQLAGRGRLNCRRGQAPTLHPGDCLEFVHNTVIPTNRGTIQGTMTMQKWRPGRQSRLDDCFTAAIGPVQLLDLRLPR